MPSDRPASARPPGIFGVLTGACLGIAIFSLSWCAWAAVDSYVFQVRESRRLETSLQESTGKPALGPEAGRDRAGRTRAEAAGSGLIGRMEIARVNLESVVIEGTGGRELRRAVGHLPGSAYPGEKGNVVLSGHRDSFFRHLEDINLGDRVRLTTPDGVFDYDVVSTKIVAPNRLDVLASRGISELTLITCYPFRYIGPAPERYIVKARLEAAALPAPNPSMTGVTSRLRADRTK